MRPCCLQEIPDAASGLDSARQNYWLPQGVEGQVPVPEASGIPTIDPSDPLSSYWVPNGELAAHADATAVLLSDSGSG